jgi:RNA polymerase sigma-70 factor, ECF subfamily
MALTPMLPPSATHSESHDCMLLRRIAEQDRRALDELYHAYYRRLSRFLQRLTPRYQFAEEVINDTFWVVWSKAGEFRGAARVSTWIMGIAYRQAMHCLRDERRHDDGRVEDWDSNSQSTDELGEQADIQDWVTQGLRALSIDQRIALELAYFMGHSCEEIAAITDCPISTVKARMFHAREKLRRILPELGGNPTSNTL